MWFVRKPEIKKEFEEKVLANMDSMYNLALRMTRNQEDAADLVQETSLQAYRFFDRFEPETNFKAWILTILRNLFINQYRKKKKEPFQVHLDAVEDFLSLPETTGFQEEIFGESVQTSIDRLPEEMRTALILFYVEELSYKDIAQVMDCPIGTVMSRLHTARRFLKKQLMSLAKKED